MASENEVQSTRVHGLQPRAQQHDIVDGPSKWDLMLSLFDGSHAQWRPITFTVKGSGPNLPVSVVVSEVGREDGSGESWNIRGWLTTEPGTVVLIGGTVCKSGTPIRCYFSTKRRTGWLRPM